MNYLKVLAILSLLFIFCGSVYGAGEADSPDINGVDAVIDDTITVENASLTYDKLITSNNCEEVVIGDNSIWDVPIREGPIVENDNTSIPDITLKGENGNNMSFNNPADVFINESFNFQMVFKNLGDATGFQPYIQLIAPKELTHFTVSYSNRKIVPIKVGIFNESTYDNTTGLYTLRDPFTKKEVHGPANSTFYILQYPLGSFTVDAPDAVLNITSGIGVLEIGKLLNFTVTPVFRYGNSPIDDPVNYPPIYGETVTGWVNPVVVKIDKGSNLNEHETATGSNFPFSYSVNINIANGAKIENITITDVIPSDVMYLSSPVLYDSKGRVIDSSLYTIEEPAGNKTGGKLILKLKEAIGDLSATSITLKYKAYAPEFDNSTGDNITIINSKTGEGVAATSTVDINYTYVNDTYNASNSYSIYLKSLATQKYSEILTGSGQLHPVVPHNLIVYKIDFEISDYFAFDDLVIYDKFDTHKVGSAQKFLTEYEPVLSIYGKTYELNESYYSVVSLGDIDESVTFYISKFLKDNNISTSLKGGYYTNRSVNQGAMVGSLNFVAKVIIHYSNGSSVVSNDLVINHIKTSATVLNTFNTVSDNSYTQLRVPSVTLKKDIIAVDGEIINDTDFYKVYPGQNITFVLDIHFPTGSVNDFIVTDFLPIPLFNLKGFNLVNSTTGVIPKGGYWAYANDSGFLYDENTGKVIVPKIGIDTFNNALSFNFGNTLDNMANPVDVRLWFTFQVSSEPMADQLNLANLAEMKFKDSIDVVYASSNIVLMLTNEPELKITKYVNDTKILENIENATEVEYNITITNTGHSTAYDIIVADDFVNRTTSNGITKADVKAVSLVYSNGTVVDITAFKDDLFTKGYMLAQLAQNTSCSIIYTVRFSEYLIPKESIVNNVWITNFAAYPNSTNFATNKDKYRDNATIIAKGLNITKEFIGSNVTDNTEILFVGEVGIYKITVNFPDLRVPNLVIKDESYGIKYTNFTITTSDGVTVPEYAYTVTYTPSTAHPEKSYLTIEFNGDLVPAYAKNNQLIVNAYHTVVNNENVIPTGADSATTSNHASISWTNNTLNSDTIYVDIYQPKIDINKVFEPNIVQGNDEASFTITVTNSGKGTAYNTTITDDLTEFIKTFVNSRSDIGVTILKGNETGKVIFNWNNDVATLNVGELLAGQSVSAKFTFNVKNDVVIGKEFKNIAKVDYYSIFNETKFDEKRNYSNQASSTLHTYDAKVNKTVFNTTIVNGKDKVTVGENVTYNITVILPVGKYNILKITDTLPEGLKYIDGSIVVYKGNTQNKAVEGKDYTVTVNGNIVELTFASEFADEIIKEYGGKFQAFLNATVLNVNNNKAGAVKTNKAVLTWNTHESTSDVAVGIVEPAIDITKNFNVDNVIGGDVIYFDITVTNRGQSPLFNVTLSDDLTDLISKFVSGGINVTSGGAVVTPTWDNNIVSINTAELGIGKSLTYRFTFKIREDVVISSTYINTANAIGYSAPSNGRNYTDAAKDSFTTKLPVITKWVVDSSIDNGKDKVTIGEKVIYGVNVTLPVGNYTKLVIKDTLPQGFEYIGAGAFYANGTKLVNGKDWTVNVNNYDITITINNVHSSSFANGVLSINLTARPTIFDPSNKAGAVKVNNVELFLNDKTMGRSSAKVTIVEPTADITKKFNVTEVEGLDHVSFDVIVKNNGKTPLFEVTIIDDLEDLASFIGQTPGEDNVIVKVTDADGNPIDAKIRWVGSHVEIDVIQLNPGDIIHAKYSFVIRSDIQIGSQYVNMANVVGYSAPDHGRNYYNYDEDTLKTKLPVITKWVVDSSIDNGKDKVTIGEKVIYGVNVTLPVGNYTKLVIKDTLPQGFEYIGAGAFYANGTKLVNGKDWTVNVNNYDITITINNVHSSSFANGVLSINLTARPTIFDPSNKAGAVKVNNVELFLNDKTMGRSSAKVTIVEPTADITKKFNVTEVEGLDHVSFDVIVKNNGKTPLFEVTIIDDLEDLASFIGQTPGEDNVIVKVTDADGNPIDAKIRWVGSHVEIDVIQLNPGDIIHAKYSFVIRSDIQIGSQYVNMAYAVGYSAPDHGRIYYNESKDTLKTKMPTITKLVIGTTLGNKDGNIFTPTIGENVTYQIMVKLPKGNYTNLQVKDILPQGFEYLENSVILSNGTLISDVSVNGNLVTINFGNTTSYKYSDNIIFNLSAVVLNDSSNKAQSIKSNNVELYLNDDKIDNSNAQVKIAEPNISVVKTSDKQKYEYYENATYSIVITNKGNGIAYNITIKDALPLGLKYTGINSTSKSNGWVVKFDENTRTFTITGLNLTVGDKFTFTYKVSFAEWEMDGVKYSPIGQNFINSVNVAYVSINGTNSNNRTYTTQTAKEVHVTEADLSVVKNCNNEVVIAGEDIYYTVIITNNGQDTAQNVKLNEYYHSEYLTNLEYSLDGKTWNVYTNPVDLGSINSKASKTVYIRGYLDGSIVDDTILNNTVRVNTTTGELKLDDNEATNIKNVTTLAELHVTKINITEAIAGKIIKYEIVITNNGPSYARDIILKDIYNDSELTNMLYSLDGQSWTRYDASINIGTLANGQNKTILFEGFIKTTVRGNVINKAIIGSSTKLRDNSTLEDDVAVNVKGDTTLDITKVANTTLVNPGDVIKYTVQITAGGLSDSLDVILTDNLSEMFFDVSKATYSVNGIDKGAWIGNANLGTISSGMTVNVVITVPVKAYVDVGKLNSITNFASVINSDKKAANDTNIVPINVIDLAVNKTANHQNKTYNYGDNVEYVIEIVNNGPGIATDIIATDNLPEGLKFINANVPGGWTLSISNNKITINGEKLANGEKVLITIIAKAAKSNATLINNIKVNGTGFDSNISNNNDSETVKVTPLVDLAITKVVDNANPLYDSIITYTITVVNNGPDASTNVIVKDIWPEDGLKFITSTGTYNPITGIWNIGELGAGKIATLTITAETTAVGKFENKVSVNGTGYDSNLSNNNASVNITVPDCVILNITKVATGGIVSEEPNKEVIAGEKITYTVIVSNYGPSVATNVYLTDLFNADELLNMEYNSNGNWVKYNNGIALGDIDVNEAVMILFRATVNHSTRGLINNTVRITTDIKDARGNFEANETVKAIDNSTLAINKTSNVDAINPGDLFNYTIVITAGGSSDSLGVILTDKLDQSLLDAQNAVFYVNGNYVGKWNGSYNIGTLKTGNSVTVTIEVKALNSANKDIFNKAIVENEEGFINESNKTVHVNTVDLTVNKTSDKVTYKYLDNVIYTIVVTNHGPDDSFNVTVRDVLPNSLRFISASGNYNPTTGIWFIGHLAKGQSATLTITAQAIFPGIITNNANVTGSGYDVNLTNNHDNITITVPDCVILNVNKVAIGGVINITGGIKNVVAGEEVIYQVLVSNHGPSTAANVVLTDNYQTKDLTVVAYSLDNITWIPYTKGANINLGDMTSGSSILVYFKAMVNASTRGIVHNVVNITTDTDDARGIFGAEEHVNVMANTTLKVDKTAEIKELNPGDIIHYIITVTAGGSSDSLNVVLKDILDSTLLDVNSATYAVDGVNKGLWTESLSLGKIATGNSVTVDIWAKVLSSADRDVFNLVNVTSDEHPEGNTSNTTVHVRIVDLAVDKLVNDSVPKYLDMVEYTIVVVNNGPDKSFNVTVGDLLPDGVKFISSNGQYDPVTGVWFVGDLDNNESATLKIVVRVIKVGNITNIVNVTGTGHDSNLTNNNASVSVNVPDSVLLNIVKVANSTIIVAGENVGYTVTVTNNGPSVATDVVLKDIFNSNELLNLQYSLNGKDWFNYNESINLGNIDAGANITVYFRAKVNGSVRGDVLNTVNITTGVDDARGNFSDNETVNVIANTTLVVIKDAEIKELNPGDTAHFIVTVIVGGSSDSLNVNLRDILDNKLLDINSAKYSINGSILSDFNGNIYLGNMLTGTTVTVDIWVKVLDTADRDVFNLVNVTSDEHPEGNISNVSVHVRIVDLAVDKLVNNSVPKYLDMIEYTIVVVNNGPDKSFNVTVGDLLPDGVKFISSNGQYNPDTGVWFVGDLDNHESATLKIVVQVIRVGNITNNVNVTGMGHDSNLTNNNASVSVSVPDCVILDISKVANSTVIVAGENVGYTVVINNYGPSVASDVVLKDIYNAKELLGLQYSLNGNDWFNYNEAINLGNIDAGANVTVYFRAKVNGSVRGDVLNTVNITTSVDDARGNFSDNETVNVIADTTLVVIKDAEIKELNPGDTVHFIVTVIAGGSSDSLNVNLEDILDAKLLDVTGATYAVDGVNKGMWTGSIDLGNMLTGTTVTVDIWVKVLDTADRDVFNLVNVTSDEHPEGNTSNVSVHVRIVDLAVDKLVNNSVPKYLDMVEYTIVVVNNGPDKSFNVTVSDLLPDGVKFISSTGQYNPDTGVWFVGDLDNNESVTLKIVVQVIKVGNITNNVNVTGTGHDSNLTNNNDSVSVSVPDCVILDISKVANSTVIVAGENVGYTVVINNYGPSVASDVVLKDIYNAKELLGLQYSLNGNDWFNYNEAINLGNIDAGANVTVYFRAKVNGSVRGDVLNTVNITTSVDDDRGNFTDNETVNIIANTTLVVIKDAEIKELNPGDTIHYIITVTAGGSSDSLNVNLNDILDNKLLDINSAKYSINGGDLADYNGNVYLGDMLTGTAVTVDIWVKVLSSADRDVFNLVNVTSDEHPEGNTSNVSVHVRIVDLAVDKLVNNSVPKYLDMIEYTIVVVNNGPDKSFNVTVGDLLPDGVKFISSNGQYDPVAGVWFVGDLDNNESVTLKIVVQVIKVGNITNNVNVTGTGHDTNLTNNNDSVSVSVPDCVILDISKVANSTVIVAGENVGYTVTVTNNGPSVASDVVLKDIFSSNELLNLQYSLNGKDWLDYNESVSLGDINAGADITVYFRAKVNGSVRGDVLNTVNITTSVDDARGNFTDNETVNVIADTTLAVVKDAEIKELNPGDTVHFIITVIAGGSSDSLNVNLNDILDAKLLDVDGATYAVDGVNKGSWTGSIDLGNMLTGTAVTVDIWAKVLSSADRDVFNLVNVTSDEHPEGNTSNTTVHVRIVDLAVDKLVNDSVPKYLDMVEYTIVVVNNGPDKSFNVTVGDLLPDGVKFISSNGQYNPDTGVWFVGDLDNNESATLKIVVQVIKVGNITNNVNVTGTGHDTNLTNNNASVSVNVPESVLLNITKVANSTIIVAGENVGYTVVINNYGPSVASDVVLKDIFSSNELLNLQYSLNGVDWLDYNGSVSLGDINAGADVTVYFRAKVNGSVRGDVLNIVNITTGVDDARGNFTDNETVNVIANTTLAVIKDAEIKALNPGDTAHFVITVIAGGSSDSLNVKLEDILDAGLLDVKSATYRINGGNLTNYTQIISLGNMHTGSKIVVDIYAAILNTTGQDIFNCVNVTSDEHPEGNTSNTTIHVNIADLEIIKIVNNATPNYGDEITYTITVRNNGPDNSTNVKVSEVLADNFKFISANASKGYYNLTNGIWAVGNLTNNETAKLVITVKIIKTGFIQNNVSVNGTGHDPNVTNNNATVNITVPQTADLSVVKIVNVDRVTVGNRITYTIVVKNNGPDTALDVYAVDKLSDALKFVSYKASVGVYDPATGIWTIGNLTNKSNAALEITCIVLKTGVISNEVFVNGSTVDLNMTNNYGNVSVTVIPAPAPVHPADKDIMTSDGVVRGVDAMAKTGNPILALLVVLIFGIFGFGVSRRKK
ncbi:isopeptide-forming domain-containing fimbrial protein [uncultured Methanobrevibacter sp.]|uniref:isopeptide-forming domain-containing fimbrial protein n=1 Tax=uncultured Methanobrevibacter sp. TaxID=253161 RepID=UPI00259098DF|nr:isopeptide-forming domain-containing fimbrial protein [uncultured Methanobrevibacter sp.]